MGNPNSRLSGAVSHALIPSRGDSGHHLGHILRATAAPVTKTIGPRINLRFVNGVPTLSFPLAKVHFDQTRITVAMRDEQCTASHQATA